MPNRILREGILTSERVNALGWEAEVFYRRLMSVVDDFGRWTAHAALLRAALYPLKLDTVREANMERLLLECEKARLLRLYVVDGKRYLELQNFRQQVRAVASKFPSPPGECAADAQQVRSSRKADAHLDVCEDGDVDGDDNPPAPKGEGLPPVPLSLHAPEFLRAWAEWQTHRREIRHKLTPSTAAKQLAQLAGYGVAGAITSIERSIAGGWQGLFEPGKARPAAGGA
jgi:hypothetical protein